MTDARRVRAICDLLDTIRVGDTQRTWREAAGEVRRLLDVEQVLMFQVRPFLTSWKVSRWCADGAPSGFFDAYSRVLAGSPLEWAWFKPDSPDVAQRNRVVEALSASTRRRPGFFESSDLFKEAFYPYRLHRHRQLRVLLCDDAKLLGWFGAMHPRNCTRRQHGLLRALVPSLRRRMLADYRLESLGDPTQALDAALELISAPALLITVSKDLSVAIVRRTKDVAEAASRVAAAAKRWRLSKRTGEVLSRVVEGQTNSSIAQSLGVTTRAVELHVTTLLDRADVNSRTALVARVLGG